MKEKKERKQRKRAARGVGRLYKRGLDGTEYRPEEKIAGAYWLSYVVNGKRIRQPLRHEDGTAITELREAEAERKKIMGPLQAADKVDALRRTLATVESDQEKALLIANPPPQLGATWAEYVANKTRPDSGEATLQQYEWQWGRFISWLAGNYPDVQTLRDVTPDIAAKYARHLETAGISAKTYNKHVRLLQLVFRVLAQSARLAVNPWTRITRKKQHKNGGGRRELTTEELRRIIGTATGELRLLLALGLYTGLRLGDCATLRWDEVDLARGFIARIPNKTARTSGAAVKIPLFRDLAAMLAEAKKTATGDYILPEVADTYKHAPYIVTDKMQSHLSENGIDCHRKDTGRQIKRDAKGIPVRTDKGVLEFVETGKRAVVQCGFHSLRHSFVSLCREANVPLSVVESIVGHSNPAMTRLYSHTSDAAAESAVASLPSGILSEAPKQLPKREPLPGWALELVENMTTKNWKVTRDALRGDAR